MEKNELGETPFDLSKVKGVNKAIRLTKDGYEPVIIEFADKPPVPLFPGSVISCASCNLKIDESLNKEIVTGALILRRKNHGA